MALISKWSSFQRIFKSNSHNFSKIYAPGSSTDVYKHWIHTEQATSECLSSSNRTDDERQNFIEGPVPHEEVMSKLMKCSSMSEQLMTLPSLLRLTPPDIKQRHGISYLIEDMLKPFFDSCKVHLFGSSVNGFGFKGCDIDMAIHIGKGFLELMPRANDDVEIPTIEDVLSGRVTREYMSRLSITDKLIFIHTVFLDYYKDSSTAPIYISAYVPIIRFHHDFHQIKIDLTSSNWHAMVNTKWLHLYANMDSRVIPLVMGIRYWAKNAGLIGGNLMFNSYCLTLLTIYFLQQRNPPVLPTFEQISSISDSLKSEDMLDTSYLEILTKLPPSSNTETIDKLFQEFFFFFFYFDFDDVICPRNGKVLSRSNFSEAEYSKKFRFNTICVQDPIKLTHNVANLVDHKNCKKFAFEILYACRLFQAKISPPSGLWGLPALFDNDYPKKSCFDTEIYNFEIPLDWAVQKRHCTSESALLLRSAKTVVDIFKEALLFDVSMEQGDENQMKDSLEEGEERMVFFCKLSGKNNTWLGRSNLNAVEPPEVCEDILAHEKTVSLKLCEKLAHIKSHTQRRAEDRKCDFEFRCRFYGKKEDGKLVLLLKMSPLKGMRFNPILAVFLTDYIPKLTKKLL